MENPGFIIAIIVTGVVAYLIGRWQGSGSPSERVERENLMQANAEALFDNLPADVKTAIDDKLRSGKIIEAIKILREATGAGLRDAKLAIDQRRHQLSSGL